MAAWLEVVFKVVKALSFFLFYTAPAVPTSESKYGRMACRGNKIEKKQIENCHMRIYTFIVRVREENGARFIFMKRDI